LDDRISAPLGWKSAFLLLAIGVAIVVLASAAGYGAAIAFDGVSRIDEPRAFAAGETEALLTTRISVALFAFQLVTVLLAFAASAFLRRGGEPLLSFRMPEGGIRTLLLATVSLIVLATIYGALVYGFDRNAFRHDLRPFAEMMKSRTWWLVLIAAGIGAPLAEECLFRGLLFGGLKQTPVGVSGAALITAVTWAALHANYSAYGLTAITLIGLSLAFVRERTGTLLTSIVCHGAYNSLIVLVLVFSPNNLLVT
jgi:membrane protease YdiL (CAAX protease family)